MAIHGGKDRDTKDTPAATGRTARPGGGHSRGNTSRLSADQRVCDTCKGAGGRCTACGGRGYIDLRLI